MSAWDDAVEAAARRHFERFGVGEWSDTSGMSQEFYLRDSAAELRAALPHLLEPLRGKHSPVEVHAYDSVNGVWRLDEDGEHITLTRLCAECSDDGVLEALGDCDWCEGDGVEWPCPTVALLDQIETEAKS